MKIGVLKSLLRITIAVVLFLLAGAALIRQPTITSLDYGIARGLSLHITSIS